MIYCKFCRREEEPREGRCPGCGMPVDKAHEKRPRGVLQLGECPCCGASVRVPNRGKAAHCAKCGLLYQSRATPKWKYS